MESELVVFFIAICLGLCIFASGPGKQGPRHR